MKIANKPKTIAIVTTVLMMASVFWLLSVKQMNSSLSFNLDEERLRSETLLSEKLVLEKDIEKMKVKILDMREKNSDLSRIAKTTSKKLESQEAEFRKLKKENGTLAQIKKQRQQLADLQLELEKELNALKTSYADLESKNLGLSQSVTALEERNKILELDLNRALIASVDQSQMEAVKGRKEKLTVRARKADKLVANFEVPASLKNLSFRMVDPKGKVLSRNDGTFVTLTKPSENNVIASSGQVALVNQLQTVEMEYEPNNKLGSGIYTLEILNDNLYVGSLKIKLR